MKRPYSWFDDYEMHDTVVSPHRAIYESDVLDYVRFTNDVRAVMPGDDASLGPQLQVPDLLLFSLGICMLLHAEQTYVPQEFVAFYGFDVIDFHRQALVGEIVVSKAVVTQLERRAANGIVTFTHETFNAEGDVFVSSVQRLLVRCRAESGGEGV
jgi:hypothetical protein